MLVDGVTNMTTEAHLGPVVEHPRAGERRTLVNVPGAWPESADRHVS